jgi:outer membrane receptor protein involved in Fe transport
MRLKSAVITVVLCLTTIFGAAQEITGDIRGIVHDPSGAVVSGAKVQVINTDRNVTIRALTTGADGSYVAPYLPVGHYKVTVQAEGFATFTANDISLNVSDRRTVDVKLQVNAASNTIEVQEAPAQVNLEDATASGLMTGTQIRELSIATRNYEQLVSLVPGVSTNLASDQLFVGVSNPTGTSNQVNFSVSGNRPTQNNWTIDGADNVDRGANLTLLNYPSVESIAEFNVLRSNYLPEHGRSSSGEVTVITRSGTSSLHGSAYEFFRNDKLNANNFFNNRANINRPELRWNDFGFTLGGPVYIPGVYTHKDKTFFFYSQEWRRIITYNTFTSSELPTAAEQAGTFASPVCLGVDASGNCNSTGTQVAAINPVAQAYVKDIYSKIAANNADNTLTWVGRNIFDYREENIRIDHNFSSNFSIFGRYLDDSIPTEEPGGLFTGLGIPGVSNTSTNSPGRNFSVHGTWTIRPTLLADLGYAYSYGAVLSTPAGTSLLANSPDINPTLPFGLAGRVPDLSFNDGQGISGFGPYRDYNRNHNAFANVTKAWGQHSFKFGASYNYYTKDENVNGFGHNGYNPNGFYSFDDTLGGGPADGTFQQEWANFLMGNVSTFQQTNIDFRALVHQRQWEFYGQDEWRIRPNFTLDYGVRYSLFLAPTYGNGLLTTFDPATFNPANVPAIDSNGLYVTAPSTPYLNGISIGGQNSPYGDAVQRTAKNAFAPRLGFAWDPWKEGKTSIRGGFGMFYDSPAVNSLEQFQPGNPPFVSSTIISNTSLNDPASGIADVSLAPPFVGGVAPNWKQPYSMMWNLDFQQQLTPSTILDVGYYSTQGRHLIGVVDINQPQPGAFQSIGLTSPVGAGLQTQKLNQIRPYLGYDAIDLFEPVFTSNYNGLQAQLQKHFSANSTVVVNYTWSHALGTATNDYRAPQNTYDIRAEYGNLDFDRRHVFNASYVYTLPFFKNQEGVTGHILGGWEVSGILYLNTGSHLTPSYSRDPAGLGVRDPNTFEGGRPDQVGDPNAGAPHTIADWFNKNAFAGVPAGQIRPGNAPRGSIVGPGYGRWDASLFKNTRISERFNLQFRAEGFNVLNHTNLNNPASASLTSGLYAKITSARDPRQIQLALKLIF